MKKVLLLFGGESTEHDVSVMSAKNIYDSIYLNKFQVTLGYILRDGRLTVVDDFNSLESGNELIVILGKKKFQIANTNDYYEPDVILPILHGYGGEDGSIQGLAQLMQIPIVGSNIESSAVCMNKLTTKRILESADIKNAPYVVLNKAENLPTFTELSKKLGRKLFIKPLCQGSSKGVSKAENKDEFQMAVGLAFKYGDAILVEKAINGLELEVAVLGNAPNLQTSGVGEIVSNAKFYDYNTKYNTDSVAQTIIPAKIDNQIFVEIQNIAKKTFTILGCSGMARVDFFLNGKEIFVNEVNTIPGFTNNSMYPKLWLDSGLSYPDLVEKLINLALEKS